MKRFATPPKSVKNCLVFEDSLTGIKDAIASGMITVLIKPLGNNHFDGVKDRIHESLTPSMTSNQNPLVYLLINQSDDDGF